MYDVATVADGTGSYTWNTAGIAAGTYYLQRLSLGCHPDEPTYNELVTPIVISDFSLSPPASERLPPDKMSPFNGPRRGLCQPQQDHQPGLRHEPHAALLGLATISMSIKSPRPTARASYAWNTAGVAAGTYYLSGYLGMIT